MKPTFAAIPHFWDQNATTHTVVYYIFCRLEFPSNALRHFNFPEEDLEKDWKSQDFFPNTK